MTLEEQNKLTYNFPNYASLTEDDHNHFKNWVQKIKGRINKQPDITTEELGRVFKLSTEDIQKILKYMRETEGLSFETPDLYERVVGLLMRFPNLSNHDGAMECGVWPIRWHNAVKTVIRKGMLDLEKLEYLRKLDTETYTQATPEPQPEKPEKDVMKEIEKESRRAIKSILKGKDDDSTEAVIDQMLKNQLQESPQGFENILPSQELLTIDQVMDNLWMLLLKSVADKKLKPKNFSEAKQLLELQFNYIKQFNEQRQREQESNPFRPYKDADIVEILEWITSILSVIKWLGTRVDKKRLADIDKIRAECRELLPVVTEKAVKQESPEENLLTV